MLLHGGADGLHAKFVQLNLVVHLEGVFLNAEQRLKTTIFTFTLIEGHDGLTQPKQQPTRACLPVVGRPDVHGTRLLVEGQGTDHNAENINATASLFKQIAVLDFNHASAPYGTASSNPLLKSAAIVRKHELFQGRTCTAETMVFSAAPLRSEEAPLLEEGLALFDQGKFWHAHEAWEDMWNMLKKRAAPAEEVLLIQGLIQTAALLLHHQRKNIPGVEKQWDKLRPKLEGWGTAWDLDIATHLQAIEGYVNDVGVWNLVAHHHQLPRA